MIQVQYTDNSGYTPRDEKVSLGEFLQVVNKPRSSADTGSYSLESPDGKLAREIDNLRGFIGQLTEHLLRTEKLTPEELTGLLSKVTHSWYTTDIHVTHESAR